MSEIKKKKILWVVYGFVQAGGERYVFEICKALNKDKYLVDVLHLNPLGYEKAWATEYYYQPTLESGCNIINMQDLLMGNKLPERNIVQRTTGYFKKKIGLGKKQHLSNSEYVLNFLKEYDHVNFSGTAVFRSLCVDLKIYPKNAIIHILTAQFQVAKDLYEGYDKSLSYFFVSSIPEKSQRQDLAAFENYQLVYFPLCFQTKPYEININPKKKDQYRIAVFTRLSPMKPLDPYFYALKLLREQNVDVILDIYGAGDPDKLGLIRQLNYLHIRDCVFFKGHTESIEKTLKIGDINLIWFQSNNNVPAGYAALEISMSGIPQIFWDFAQIEENNLLREIFPAFTSITHFVDYSKELLNNNKSRQTLGDIQREHVLNNNSTEGKIKILEQIFDR